MGLYLPRRSCPTIAGVVEEFGGTYTCLLKRHSVLGIYAILAAAAWHMRRAHAIELLGMFYMADVASCRGSNRIAALSSVCYVAGLCPRVPMRL